jgi:hypothetical protein
MTRYTVQCSYAAYYGHDVVVEADTLDHALDEAVAQANESTDWYSQDVCGDTFIDAVAQGDVDLWAGDVPDRHLPIPARFTEKGEGPRIIVIVLGGVVQPSPSMAAMPASKSATTTTRTIRKQKSMQKGGVMR